jgi:ribosomal protein L15
VLIKGLNIASLEEQYSRLVNEGIVKEESGVSVVDLSKLKADKLLSCGTPTRKYKILAKYASQKAIEKISAAKGEVIVENAPQEQASEE